MEDFIQLNLSYDEYAWLAYKLKLPPLLGGRVFYPKTVSEELKQARLQAGAMALQARGLIELAEDKSIVLDALLTAFAGTIHFAGQSLVLHLGTIKDEQSQQYSYYLSPELWMEHHFVRHQLMHKFTLANDVERLLTLLLSHIGQISQSYPLDLELPTAAFLKITQALFKRESTEEESLQQLIQLGLPEQNAQWFMAMLTKGQSAALLILEPERKDDKVVIQSEGSLTLYHYQDYLLAIQPDDEKTHIFAPNQNGFMQWLKSQLLLEQKFPETS